MNKKDNHTRTIDFSIFSVRREDGKVFSVGDKFTWEGNTGKTIVNDRVSRRKMKICGFEKHEKGWYVLYFQQYSNGVIEKVNPWRACDLKYAIIIK